ncbi:ArnT family glycosyltransferase [Actinophytocola oryzae]|uniref:4-amino-4-deoxy-L-arabinose transferase-like glycosyltransferase n=1 Tax=Actinophytocola oryzae TaxID=502181 RepID=A0A4R7V1P2_9PSEU|nr:glycosyltransferase family 39 protein [Actinophytocola oryzae]TDV41326.1 4-amino-4-deoxy-L-arabinose transferase-like glycosyltransferase [Actinophytocola oryzae]
MREPIGVLSPAAPATTDGTPPRRFARLPVLGVAAATGAVLLAVSGKFGYFGDELYFLASAKYHPAWGYADNPWLLPLLARLSDTVAPGSVVALRVLPMLLTVAGVVLAAAIAREFGGGARAQVMTAAAYALSFQLLASGHLLATSTVDPFCWVLVCWLAARWVRTRADRLLLCACLVTAVAMQGKFLIAFLWIGLVAGALLAGPRTLWRRPALWVGGAVTVLVTLPTLVWQARHDWPYLLMNAVVAEQNDRLLGGTAGMVPLAVLMAGLPVGAFLCCHGLVVLLRDPELRAFRLFGWATVVVTLFFLLTASRYYYVAGLYAVLFAASAVRLERRPPARWWRWVPTWPVYALSVPLAVYLALPVRPATGFTGVGLVDFVGSGSYGWPSLADTVAESYRELRPEDRAHTVVVGDNYWQASALAVYGADRGLPAAYGPERGYWYAGAPPEDTRLVLYAGGDRGTLARFFGEVRQVNTVRLDINATVANQGVPVWLCGAPKEPWPQLWQHMHRP